MILTTSQIQAVISFNNAIASGKSKTEAADAVGVSRSTIARWLTADNVPAAKKVRKPTAKAKPAAKAKAPAKPKKVKVVKATKVVYAEIDTSDEIYQSVVNILDTNSGISDFTPEAKLKSDLDLQDHEILQVVIEIEEEFDVKFDDAEYETVGDLYRALQLLLPDVDNKLEVESTPLAAAPEQVKDILVPFQAIVLSTTLTVVRDGKPVQIDKSHANYDKINMIVKNTIGGKIYSKDLEALYALMDMKSAMAKWSNGRITVEKGGVHVDGKRMSGKLAEVMMRCLEENDEAGLTKFAKFQDKISQSGSFKVNTRLFEFVTKTGLRIDGDGDIVALKVVRRDYKDKHSGTFDNSPGKTVEMPRNEVNDNDLQTCSNGLHICAPGYISHFSSNGSGDRLVECKVDPRDIVSVPVDYNFDKCRCCKYIVMGDVSAAYKKELYHA